MRFVLLVAGATAAGALSATAIQSIIPQTAQTFAAVRALGGDPASFKLDLASLNPFKAYEEVKRQIASGEINSPIKLQAAIPDYGIKPINIDALRPSLKLDEGEIQRAIAAGINARAQADYRRTQDLIAYGRNPMGWHGVPPH